MPPKAKGAKKKGGYQMPEKFDDGFQLKDVFKNNWTLGKPIGQGGFGLIYLANKGEGKVKNPDDAQFVVKIEPKDNGPLFCETHFYINCAKEDECLCTYNEKEYRFLVMDRFAKDLQTFLNQNPSHQINEIGVLCLMRQILYALEYIHNKGYAHGDIKGANLMLKNDNESYLVDFGLAYRFKRDDIHQKYDIKPERRHNGTIEYTSRDAHNGAQIFRRSDLEILGFCALHWLSGTLPWIDLIKNAEQVQQSKNKSMSNVKEFVNNTFKSVNNVSESVKSFIEYYLNEVNKLEFDTEPSYSKIQSKLTETLRLLGHSQNSIDNFRLFTATKSHTKTTQKKAIAEEEACSNEQESETDTSNIINGSARVKRVNKAKKIDYSSNEEDEEDFKQAKPTPKPKTKPQTPKPKSTKKATKKKELVSDNDENEIENLSILDNDSHFITGKASKKAPSIFQSTAIDQTEMKHSLIEAPPKSPATRRAPITRQAWNISPELSSTRNPNENALMVTTGSGSKARSNNPKKRLDSDSDQDNSNQQPSTPVIKSNINIQNRFPTLTITPKPTEKAEILNGAQLDVLNKFKSNNHLTNSNTKNIEQQPRSPLALVNLEKNCEFILVKKRKNVCKADACTQTDISCLQSNKHKLKN